MKRIKQDFVIRKFIIFLKKFYPGLKITCWPDKVNRSSKEVDAIAENSIDKIAIEHTTIDTFENQRQDSHYFMEAIGKLQKELKGKIQYRIRVYVKVGVVPKGYPWKEIRKRIKNWLLANQHKIPQQRKRVRVKEVPFDIYVSKDDSENPGLFPGRFTPTNSKFFKGVKNQLKEKAKKLKKYSKSHKRILLVESSDLALMNPQIFQKKINNFFPKRLPPGSDEIWYADSSFLKNLNFRRVRSNTKVPGTQARIQPIENLQS